MVSYIIINEDYKGTLCRKEKNMVIDTLRDIIADAMGARLKMDASEIT